MLYLKVQSSSDTARDETTVCRTSLDLRLEPTHRFASFTRLFRGVTIHVLKVVRQGKQNGQCQRGRNTHEHDVAQGSHEVVLLKGHNGVNVDVKEAQTNCELSTVLDVIRIHLEPNSLGTTLTKIKNFWIEDGRQPVSSQYYHVVESLEGVHPSATLVAQRVIVKQHEWLGTETIRILGIVIGVGVVSPMLLHPQPLAATNKISTQPQNVVNPRCLGGCSVIGVVLHIQTNQSLRYTIDNRECDSRTREDPQVLKTKEESNIKEATEEPSKSSKLASSSDDLEDFSLDFLLEGSIKLITLNRQREEWCEWSLEERTV